MKYRRANGRGGEIQEEKKKERKMIVLIAQNIKTLTEIINFLSKSL